MSIWEFANKEFHEYKFIKNSEKPHPAKLFRGSYIA